MGSGGRACHLIRAGGTGAGRGARPRDSGPSPDRWFALYDVGHSAVLLYDDTLGFERRIQLKGGLVSNPKSMAVLTDGSFVIAGGRLRDPRHLHRYGPDGDWLESHGDPSPHVKSPMARIQVAGGAVRVVPQGLLFSVGAPLRLVRFPAAQLRSPTLIAEDRRLLPEPTDESLHGPPDASAGGTRQFLWWHERSTGVFELSAGRILNVVTRYHRGDSVWDLYDRTGTLLSRTVVPRAYYAWDLTRDGHILASYRDPQTDEHLAVVLRLTVSEGR